MITRLDVVRRFAEGEKLDVELVATAYERVKESAKHKPGVKGGKT